MINLALTAYTLRSIIQDDDFEISYQNHQISFTIFNCSIVTDGKTFFDSTILDKKIHIRIGGVEDLYRYVLVQLSIHTGMYRHTNTVMTLKDLYFKELKHLERLVDNEVFETLESALESITYTTGAPKDVSKMLNVNEKFIKNIRTRNRKRILKASIEDGLKTYNISIAEEKK